MWTTRADSAVDGGFAAGLIAGDGHFLIRPNNAGSTWACGLAVGLRADDTPLLARLCRWSALGKLHAVPARGTSKPQTHWLVQRQTDCLGLTSILDRHRLLGKKLGEYAIWRRAVLAWTGRRSDRHAVMAAEAEHLRAYRAPERLPASSEVSITEQHLRAFLAGFVTAEAHFGATPGGHPLFTINLRSDDGELLRLFRDRLGIGRLVDVPPFRTSRAARSWRIGRLAELRRLVHCLDHYPPRGRVLRIYEAWRELVLLENRGAGARRELAAEVRRRRLYKPGLETIVQVNGFEARRARHVGVLRTWAAACEGPRTATAYQAWRKACCPHAPTPDTITTSFGSWIDAVTAAGLSTEGCRSSIATERFRAATADARSARRESQRAVVLEAARECERSLGRVPCATEFFGWRNRCAPELPAQMTVYRAFPGGWNAVLEALARSAASVAD